MAPTDHVPTMSSSRGPADSEGSVELFVVAGEASGDLHAAHAMSAISRLAPEIRFCGLGGDRMQAVGMDSVAHSRDISVVGLVEVLKILPRAKRIFDDLVELASRRRPRAALLVDAPDFNLRLARKLADLDIPVVFYVSPQIWAWRSGRVAGMRGVIDLMLVLFPFEETFYRDAGIDVVHVGHPLLDQIPPSDHSAAPSGTWIIGLLPGSRNSEVRRNLPNMLGAATDLAATTGSAIRLLLAPDVDRAWIENLIEVCPIEVEVVAAGSDQRRYAAIAECRVALCASGTATLEVGLLGVPLVVSYRVAPVTFALARRLVQVPHISLVNLVLGREVVPELVQGQATRERIAAAGRALMNAGEPRNRMLADLAELRPALGEPGASHRVAREVIRVIGMTGSGPGLGTSAESTPQKTEPGRWS